MLSKPPECEYPCEFHKGKVKWHHPVAERWELGLYLCEAHHSILQGRKKRYSGECLIDKGLAEMRIELQDMERHLLAEHALTPNKH